jgi:hypothetical protein
MGKSLGGPTTHKESVGNLVYRAGCSMNLMQDQYKTSLFMVGGKSRLFLRRDRYASTSGGRPSARAFDSRGRTLGR